MSSPQNSGERRARPSCFGQLTQFILLIVAVIGCLAAVLVVPEVRQMLRLDQAPPAAITSNNPTRSTPQSQVSSNLPTGAPLASEVNISGIWEGVFVYEVGDTTRNYRLQLQLSQSGQIITGKSRMEQMEDTGNFVEYVISAQIIEDQGQSLIQITETDLSSSVGYMDFDVVAPVVSKVFSLTYRVNDGQELLEGQWRAFVDDRTDGIVQLSKQS